MQLRFFRPDILGVWSLLTAAVILPNSKSEELGFLALVEELRKVWVNWGQSYQQPNQTSAGWHCREGLDFVSLVCRC